MSKRSEPHSQTSIVPGIVIATASSPGDDTGVLEGFEHLLDAGESFFVVVRFHHERPRIIEEVALSALYRLAHIQLNQSAGIFKGEARCRRSQRGCPGGDERRVG